MNDPKNKKSCILTPSGREKFNAALNQRYPETYKFTQIKNEIKKETGQNIDREVISKIINDPEKAVSYDKLDIFFSFLGLDLEEDDYENPPKNKTLKTQKSIIKNISNQDMIKNAVRDLNYQSQIQDFTVF